MAFDRERGIAAQNAGTTAANLVASAVAAGTLAPASVDELVIEFEQLRTTVFQGTLALAGAETIVETFESPTTPAADSFDAPAVAPAASGARPHADVAVKIGKHKGKTIGQIFQEDEGWLEWASQNVSNDWLKGRIREFLAA